MIKNAIEEHKHKLYKEIYIDYITEMVQKLQNVNNTEANAATGARSYSILNHYKILINDLSSIPNNITINHLVPNT